MKRTPISIAGLLALCLTAVPEAWAVPSFSRKYGTGCTTCHEAFPRRTIVGEAFRLRGYQFADDETYVKTPPVELGDEAYNRLWPRAVWSSDVPSSFPLSVITKFLLEADLDGSRESEVLFLFPEEIEVVWAGTLGQHFSFYGDIIWLQKDIEDGEIESWAQLKARLSMHDIVGPRNLLNVNVGSVGMQTLGLYPCLPENNLSTHYYQYSSWTLPGVNLGEAALTAFRGNPFSMQPQVGFEVYGFGPRWKYAAAVVSGDVLYAADAVPDSDVIFLGTGRTRGNKDGYASFSYKFGGLGFDGSGAGVTDPLQAHPQYWRDDGLIATALGYVGTAQIQGDTVAGASWEGEDFFWRAGAGLQHKYRDLTVAAGYTFGRNERPYGDLSSEAVDSHALFGEASYYVYPWLIPYVRYEALYLGLPEDVAGLNPEHDTERIMLGVKALVRQNIAVTLETTIFLEGEEVQEGFDRTLMLLLSAAF